LPAAARTSYHIEISLGETGVARRNATGKVQPGMAANKQWLLQAARDGNEEKYVTYN
jgi:hypothetical protein